MKKLKDQSKNRIPKLILTLFITLISIPAISMMAAGSLHVDILECCCGCGLCADTYPESFVMNPETDRAEVVSSFIPENVKAAQADCPKEAIMTSW